MAKKVMVLMIIGLLLLFVASSYSANIKAHSSIKARTQGSKINKATYSPSVTGDEDISQAPYHPGFPGVILDSPGEVVGWTQYDYQTNGSSGNRIAVDGTGAIHFDWMHGHNGIVGANRYVDYNFRDASGWGWPSGPSPTGGEQASRSATAGYPQITLTGDDRGVVVYHQAAPAGSETTFVAIDAFQGLGTFTYHAKTVWIGSSHCVWPYETIDRTGRLHEVATQTTTVTKHIMCYRRSSDGGNTWTATAFVDTNATISSVIVSSPVSDKVAIVYTKTFFPFDTSDANHGGWIQHFNDVFYVQSADGVTWDFANGKVNITNYGNSDTSFAVYTDCDAVYDYNDNLHIIWGAEARIDTQLYYLTYLSHYSTGTSTINVINKSDSLWINNSCVGTSGASSFGAWNGIIAKMSIGADAQNDLFATYTGWYLNDIAADDCPNGEIFMSYSNDNGATWTLRGNLTNSHTDSCLAGDCDSDHWSSLAEKVDTSLHIFYVNDKDAGGLPQSEGSITDNPMMYLDYRNPVQTQAVPTAPPLVFPYNASTNNFAYFVFEWDSPVGVLHYDIQVDDNQDFSSPIYSDNNVTGWQWINPKALFNGTYYWHVKSVGYYGESAWSPTWSFTVEGIEGIKGIVTGPNSQALANVTVGVILNDTLFYDLTDATGYYTLRQQPGTYVVHFAKDGFREDSVSNVVVTDDNFTTANFQMANAGCVYLPGDINGNGSVNGVDIVFAVNYFKGTGGHPPVDCFPSCPLTPNPFYAAGDVNGNCAFNGIDITFFVRYLKGQVPSLLYCADCPPAP